MKGIQREREREREVTEVRTKPTEPSDSGTDKRSLTSQNKESKTTLGIMVESVEELKRSLFPSIAGTTSVMSLIDYKSLKKIVTAVFAKLNLMTDFRSPGIVFKKD